MDELIKEILESSGYRVESPDYCRLHGLIKSSFYILANSYIAQKTAEINEASRQIMAISMGKSLFTHDKSNVETVDKLLSYSTQQLLHLMGYSKD